MTYKSTLLDEQSTKKSLVTLAHKLAEYNADSELYLLSIQARGDAIAKEISDIIKMVYAKPVVIIDSIMVNLFKDNPPPISLPKTTSIVIITDVVHTGKNVKAIIKAMKDFVPNPPQLLTLVLNSKARLKVSAVFAAVKMPLEDSDIAIVNVNEVDGKDIIELYCV